MEWHKLFRTSIVVIYQKNGHLPIYLSCLLAELRKYVTKLVIVINGSLDEIENINDVADLVITRENKGFDSGALKCALHNAEVKSMIQHSDELVFCNDTFYGPFVSFNKIFSKMEKSTADFWGLNLSDNGLSQFIQSFFLVFKSTILKSGSLYEFFDTKINENEEDFKSVLEIYEQGIFKFLLQKGYSYDYYNKQEHHILKAADASVILDKLPILKIKFFSKDYFNETKALNALSYIFTNYDYDISLILSDIYNRFNINISKEQVESHKIEDLDVKYKGFDYFDLHKILDFIKKNKQIYIYGCGAYGQLLLKSLPEGSVKGFIVSDAKNCYDYVEEIPVSEISLFKNNVNVPIAIALNTKHAKEVKPLLNGFSNVLYLW